MHRPCRIKSGRADALFRDIRWNELFPVSTEQIGYMDDYFLRGGGIFRMLFRIYNRQNEM